MSLQRRSAFYIEACHHKRLKFIFHSLSIWDTLNAKVLMNNNTDKVRISLTHGVLPPPKMKSEHSTRSVQEVVLTVLEYPRFFTFSKNSHNTTMKIVILQSHPQHQNHQQQLHKPRHQHRPHKLKPPLEHNPQRDELAVIHRQQVPYNCSGCFCHTRGVRHNTTGPTCKTASRLTLLLVQNLNANQQNLC